MENLKKLTNKELLELHAKLLIEIKPIPLVLVMEMNKRSLKKNYKGIYTS